MKVAHLQTCPTCRAEGKQNRLFGEFGQEAVACDAGHQFASLASAGNPFTVPTKAPTVARVGAQEPPERFVKEPPTRGPSPPPAAVLAPAVKESWVHPEPAQTWKGDMASLVESSVPIGTTTATESSTTGSTTFVPAPELDTRRLPEPRIIPGGDVLHTCRLSERHAQDIASEASAQGMTFSQYFQSRLEWLLDSGWMGSPVAPPKK